MRWARWSLGALLFPFVAYGSTALILALAPVNADRIAPAQGVLIYVASNGVHTDLLAPRNAAGVNWREEFPTSDFPSVAEEAEYLGFGWGDRDFYMVTRTWADVSASRVWRALTGEGPSVLKVGNYREPVPGDHVVSMLLTEAEYHRLASYLRRALVRGADAAPLIYPGSGYGDHDAFYAANGRYSLFLTCNEWLAAGLREAGVRAPLWSPFASPLLWWMR